MNSRERVALALDHKEADVVPSDLGATIFTSLHIKPYYDLRYYLGFSPVEINLWDIPRQLVAVGNDIREHFKIDVTGFIPNPALTSTPVHSQDEIDGFSTVTDEWGVRRKMPKIGGVNYEIYQFPQRKDDLTVKDIEGYPWPDPTDPARFDGMRENVKQTLELEERAVVMGGASGGFIEMAGWFFGIENTLAYLETQPKLLECFFDRLLEFKMAYWERMLAEVGDLVCAVVESDELGGEQDVLIQPAMYRQYVKPRFQKLSEYIKSKSQARVFFHTNGAIRKLIPDLIEAGVDILNPVSAARAGMGSADLKHEYGKDLVFWGGGVDTKKVLSTGTIQQVRDDVHRRIDDFAPGGGFVFAADDAVPDTVPPENLIAAWEALSEFGVYKK